MEDILEAYRRVRSGQPDNTVFNYSNINLHFSGNVLNIYDYNGDMPCGRYKLPPSEEVLVEKLAELDDKVSELLANHQFLCGKCGGTFDLPEYTRDRFGAYVCESCANGGDIRKPKEESKKQTKESDAESSKADPLAKNAASQPAKISQITVESAIDFLKQQGYVIRKTVKSFKVIYIGEDGKESISQDYYKSKENFIEVFPKAKFISIIKELSKSEEEKLDK